MAFALYKKLQQLKVNISVNNGQLDVEAPKGVLTGTLLDEIRLHKKDLIELITTYRKKKALYDAIPVVAPHAHYALSSPQRRLWLLSQLPQGNIAYNISRVFIFEGELNLSSLQFAFSSLIERHESLRTTFGEDAQGHLVQIIKAAEVIGFSVTDHDLRGEADPGAAAKELVQEAYNRPFDLVNGPLLRAALFRIADTQWVFAFTMHHIISDGWSMNILVRELMAFYYAHSNGVTYEPDPLRVHYKDYAVWQQHQLESGAFDIHKTYWLQQLAGELPVPELPYDKTRAAVKTYNGGIVTVPVPEVLYRGIQQFSQEQGGSLFMGLVAMVNLLLYRYTGEEDLITGSPIAGREHADLENQIGFYLNALALRARVKGNDNFRDLFSHVRQITLEAYEHQAYPFDELLQQLNLQRDTSRNPLFDVFIDLQTAGTFSSTPAMQPEKLQVNAYEATTHVISKFDLTFLFIEQDGQLNLLLEYNSDLFERATAERIGFHFEGLLKAALSTPDLAVSKLDYLGEEEKHKLLVAFNTVPKNYNTYRSVLSLFEEQVTMSENSTAIVYAGKRLTYKQLDEQSTKLAASLLNEYQLRKGDMVGILLDRSEKMIVAILGILKAGGVYVPIDPAYPKPRIDYIVKDAGLQLLITETAYMFDLGDYAGQIFSIDIQLDTLPPAVNITLPAIDEMDLAYVIYTSGSTGQPKGCTITHGGLSNYIQWSNNYYFPGSRRANFGLYTSLSFDLTVTSIFCSLTTGGALTVYKQEQATEDILQHYFHLDSGNDSIKLTPSHINLLGHLDIQSKAVICAVVGGEQITPQQVHILKRINPAMEIYNEYGPTEATVGCIVKLLQEEEPVQIGRPIAQTRIYMLDAAQMLCPVGVVGEICIGGAGLARGYLNNPQLTELKFVNDPFQDGATIYRTGDLGRWRADGNIEFIGRRDDQVKIRGYRIEPDEISNVLQHHEHILEAAVLTKRNEKGELELVAYFVGKVTIHAAVLRQYLAARLPAWMLPAYYIQVEKIPLNINGKLDKKALPDPHGMSHETGVPYEAPRTEEERVLIAICEEVLKKQRIGIQDDFFVLGGDSIKSIQVVARLKQQGYTLPIQDVLLYPVLEELAARISSSGRSIDQELVTGLIPLSPIQQWFFTNNSGNSHHYNQSILLQSKGRLSEAALRTALDELVLHHDTLRMVYRQTAQGWVQENLGREQQYGFEIVEVVTPENFEQHCEQVQSGISLQEGPLLRVCLFRGAEADRLLLVIHHLVTDGVSWRILLEDLGNLYEQFLSGSPLQLPLKTDSFKYWMQQQLEYSNSTVLQQEEAWWSSLAIEPHPSIRIDNSEGSNLEKDRASCSFMLDEQLTEQLFTRCYKAYHTGTNDILLTALGLALSSVMDLDRLLISVEGHGRENIGAETDLSRTVGWFTTMYPVVLDLSYRDNRIAQLIAIKEHLHRVPNKGIGYGILRYLKGRTHGPDPQISFNYLGDFGDGTAAGSSNPLGELSGEPQGNRIGPDRQRETLLDITGITIGGKLRLSISYSNEQYNKSTIEELTRIYRQELEALIGELSITTTERLTPVDLTWKELSVAQWEVLNRDEQIEDVYPLSPLQEGLYYQWLMNPRAGAYFEQMCYGVQDELDLAQLAKSYELLVERHAVLRTCFSRELGERPLQLVKKTVANGFHYEDKTTDRDFSVEALRAADRSKGFDLHQGSQMRLTLIKLDQDRYEFVWSHHHILMDGWCVGILIKEFFEIYYSLQQSREAALPKVQPYARYIEWLGKQDREASLSYWKNYLSGYDTMSVLPKKETVANRAFLPQSVGFSLEESLRQSVRNICDELAITESSFIQAAWGILLSRYNNTSDVVFGAVVSGRPAELKGVEEMIGMFINTIPVRITINSTATVAALLKATQQASINNVGDRYLQLGEIQEALSPGRELFDHIILFQNFPVQQLVEESMPVGSKGNSLSMTSFKVFAQNNFDFTMMVNPARTFSIRFDYNGNIYAEDKVRQLQECLTQIIEQIVNDPSAAVKDITGLSDEERNKVLRSFNDIVPNYTGYQSVTALIEAEAVRHPENVAISFGSTAVSYRELNDQAGRLAAYLINNYGIGANDRIGILLDRSPLMIVGVLGVLKAGGAYVPIDPEYPRTRREYILQDAGVKVLLTQSDYIYDLDAYQGPIVAMDLQLSGITDAPVHSAATAGEALAYVIYTSGSTGNPKGCAITHGSLSNYIQWSNNYYFSNGKPASFGLFTSLSFDLTVTSIFCTLTQSGTLTVYPQTTALAEVLMHSFSAESSVNSIKLTPSHIGLMKYLTLSSDTMRRAIVGGEQLTAEQVDILKKIAPAIEIYNEYGPTETTVGCVVARIEQGERVVIGKPIAHTAIYILNEDNNPCGTDIPGEICIAGAGLAYGYLNNPELTAAKFVSNPYGAGERMYRTGDLGKWLPDGSLVFIGRRDDQVKIRGYRVEPGEIENVILKYESVDTAVVMVRSNNDEQELAAYIKAKSELDLSALKSWLLTRLPAWMLPAHLLQLDSLPLTVNGKIDRSKLPAPGAFNRLESQGHELPRNEIEEQLVQIWRELLGRARISITDNFFDVGGNSIRIVRLASLVSNLLGREISVALLFEYPSIKGLVDHIVQEPVPANEEVYEQEELITAFNKFNIEAHE